MQYYEINEQTARRANDVNSMSDYRPGSATEEYRAAVDKAAALVQARKAKRRHSKAWRPPKPNTGILRGMTA